MGGCCFDMDFPCASSRGLRRTCDPIDTCAGRLRKCGEWAVFLTAPEHVRISTASMNVVPLCVGVARHTV